MLEARKKKWFNKLFATFVTRRQVRPTFHNLYVRADDVPTPGLFLSTHSSWWDGLIMYMLNEHYLHHDTHVLMDEAGLRRFPFFRHLGAFSIQKGRRSEVLASLTYATELLQDGKSVWMFPQGQEFPQEYRPLEIGSGATFLLTDAPVTLCAMYYAFSRHAEPIVYVRFRRHDVRSTKRRAQKEELAQALETLYDDVRKDVIDGSDGYMPLFPARRNLADWTEAFIRLWRERR